MEIAIIILNWNAAADTIACVQSLQGWTAVLPKIWVVDNASADDSVVQIRTACPDVHVLACEENLGFAAGSNLGMRLALQQKNLPVMLLNNDARIGEADVARMLAILQADETIGAVVPMLCDEATGATISVGGKNPVKHVQTRVQEFDAHEELLFVECVSGTAVLLAPQFLQQVGLLDERFFFSTEVADLCLRGHKAGFRFAVALQAKAVHEVARSSRLRDTLYVYYIIRNRFLILRNHYRWNIFLWSFWALYALALAVKLRLDGKRPSSRAVWIGLLDGLTGRFGGQNERVLAYVEG
jgi:GT2 family glycosyltransferase